MRKRFEQQIEIGQLLIQDTKIPFKCRDAMIDLLAALKEIFINSEYNEQVFNILEAAILKNKKSTGRNGMGLWQIFVLSQVRLCLNISYERLHYISNQDKLLRQIMGVEKSAGFTQIEYEYQNIYDNVTLLDDETVKKLNDVIVSFGHEVFKKKRPAALLLKTDSFVVESNVHFPTDYNLLWDCARKCLDAVMKFLDKYEGIDGWRKIKNWKYETKGLMRELGKALTSGGKNKEKRIKQAAYRYLKKASSLLIKLKNGIYLFPINDEVDLAIICMLEHFIFLMEKHTDMVNRRIIKNEQIPHSEKMFSVFETYTEMIKKGKLYPNVELGKKLAITTDQFDLIVDYRLMTEEQDRAIVVELADRVLSCFKVQSWSFDKGFWNHDNKLLLQLEVPQVVMPKLGKRNQEQECEENSRLFRKLKNKHSAIESNINELENRGLDRCPDKGYHHFSRYVGLGVCAYNLKKIGRQLLKMERQTQKTSLSYCKQVA
ncbi:MAG: ISNCY family transposase [Bacteroidales bacterium]